MREMKDSGIAWVGEIPKEWLCVKAKNIIASNDGGVWGNDPSNTENDKVVLRSTEQTIDGKWTIEDPAKRDLSKIPYKSCRIYPNDLLITKSSGSSLHIGKTTLADEYFTTNECYYSNFLQRIKLKKTYYPLYAWFIFNAVFVREQFAYMQNSTSGLGNINSTDIGNIIVPIPPLDEQQRIAEFLDGECEKIDGLTRDIQAEIETLEQYKRSVITEAVTHGLDPSAPMRDSGIEWVGEIPKEWEVKKIKHLAFLIGGNGFSIELQGNENGDYPFCKASDISKAGKYIRSAVNYVTKKTVSEQHYNIIPKGAILFPKIGEAMKKNNRSICLCDCCTDNNCQAVVSFEERSKLFFYYVLVCVDMSWFDNAGTIPCMNNQKFLNSKIPVPSIEEQQKIAEFLDGECAEIDRTIADKKAQIETLDAYKKSVIYEYVTGKKEVV